MIVPIDAAEGEQIRKVVDELRDIAGPDRDGLTVNVAGPAGLLGDLIEVFTAIDGPLLLVTLVVVLIILLIVYRSPVLWIFPLLAAGMSYSLASVFVYFLAEADVIKLNGQAQGILTVLVFGAGTDYALLLIARYREELHRHDRPWDAMKTAWRGAAPAIVASGVTVIVSLLCLLLSSLNSNRALGPVAALGIAATLLVMLTFLPALLVLGGRWAFWPRTPAGATRRTRRPSTASGTGSPASSPAGPGRSGWSPPSCWPRSPSGLTQLGATTLGQSDLFTSRTDSVAGQEVIARHYPGGHRQPGHHLHHRGDRRSRWPRWRRACPGVADGPPGHPAAQAGPPDPNAQPKVVDGRVELQATLADPPDSNGAERTIRDLREAVHQVPGSDAVVGGFTAINVDTADASTRDRNVIIPVVLVVIAVDPGPAAARPARPGAADRHRGAVVPGHARALRADLPVPASASPASTSRSRCSRSSSWSPSASTTTSS